MGLIVQLWRADEVRIPSRMRLAVVVLGFIIAMSMICCVSEQSKNGKCCVGLS